MSSPRFAGRCCVAALVLLSLFSAAALVLTHYQHGASRVFEDLKLYL